MITAIALEVGDQLYGLMEKPPAGSSGDIGSNPVAVQSLWIRYSNADIAVESVKVRIR